MAKSKTALGVDLLGEEVRLVLLEVSETGPRALSAQKVAAGELGRAFRALTRRPGSVVAAVSLEHSALRILNLPPTTDENMERVIALEAESALPFQSDDLAIAYQSLGMTDQSRMEVLLAASRQSTLQHVLQTVNCAPWVSSSATVSSIALLNAVQQLRGTAREAVCSILRIEADRSELLVLDRQRVLVAQVIPVGCGAMVTAPAPQPVTVGGGEPIAALAENEPAWLAALSQHVRYAVRALSYERGIGLERLYVCGEGASRTGLDWQLSERLELPVTSLHDLGGSGATWGPEYAVAYGCALQAAGLAQAPLSLSVPRVTVAREVEQRRQARLSWGALAGAVAVAAGLIFAAAMHNKQQTLDALQAQLRQVPAEVKGPAVAPGELKSAQSDIADGLKTRVSAATAISAINGALPKNTWLAELNYNAETGCVLHGYSREPGGPQQAQLALLDRGLFDEVTMDFRNEERMGEETVWGFQLTCRLRPDDKNRGRGGRR